MGTSAQGERAQTGPSSQHTFLLPFVPWPRAHAWALLPFSLVSPIPFGVNHPRHDPQGDDGAASPSGSPGQACQARCARRSQGSCLHRRHGYLSLKARESTGQPSGAIPGSGARTGLWT